MPFSRRVHAALNRLAAGTAALMPMEKQINQNDAAPLNFEDALKRLEEIVHVLEEGDVGLNESLEKYEEGVKLLRQSYELLQKAERRIELLSGFDADGNPVATPLDDESLSLEEKAQNRGRRRTASNYATPSDDSDPKDNANGDVDDPPLLF